MTSVQLTLALAILLSLTACTSTPSPPSTVTTPSEPPAEFPSRSTDGGYYPKPAYPRGLLQEHISGTVKLRVTVAPDGTPGDIQTVETTHQALVKPCADMLAQWKFVPLPPDSPQTNRVYLVPFVFKIPTAISQPEFLRSEKESNGANNQ